MERNNEEQYVVYTEHTENRLERWFYGMYNREDANRVAENLNSYGNDEVTRCVCHISDIYRLGIQNIPDYVKEAYNTYENEKGEER